MQTDQKRYSLAADLPVESHELLALCAPRPCFISYGTVENGDAKRVEARRERAEALTDISR